MNETIAGLWRAVDEGWQNEIDHHLFALLTDAYRDADDEISAQGLEWCMKCDRRPYPSSNHWPPSNHWYGTPSWLVHCPDYTFDDRQPVKNWLPEYFEVNPRDEYEHVSEAYVILLAEWKKINPDIRTQLLNLPSEILEKLCWKPSPKY